MNGGPVRIIATVPGLSAGRFRRPLSPQRLERLDSEVKGVTEKEGEVLRREGEKQWLERSCFKGTEDGCFRSVPSGTDSIQGLGLDMTPHYHWLECRAGGF
jgi:hypothetical protein